MDAPSRNVVAKALVGLAQLVAVLGLALFLSAGTLHYVEGWLFLGVFSGAALAITLDLMRRDPELLARRVDAGPTAETRPRQKLLQAITSTAFLAIVIVPGLDRRWSWSHVPLALVVIGDVLVVLGFLAVFAVFRENSFAAATVRVEAEQTVIRTGPYARVRHPMYAGALVLLLGIPLALGSFWALLVLVPFTALLVVRLLDEEAVLSRDLPGYDDYRRQTRYRLVPHVW
jgi:protein-S-isoprenylcysteine O-methyltransferase Ste14